MANRMMFQAIETKFLGPTNVRGSRVKATAEAGSVILSYDHSLNSDENHRKAAEALCQKFGWVGEHYGTLHGGGLPRNRGCVFVFQNDGR